MKIGLQAIAATIIGFIVFGLLLFLPVWTFNYWQAWVFIVVFAISTSGPSIYLAVNNPAALERRMHAGPTAETRPVQKLLASIVAISAVQLLRQFMSLGTVTPEREKELMWLVIIHLVFVV